MKPMPVEIKEQNIIDKQRKYKKNRRELGRAYEELAAEYLKEQGCQILDRNFYSRFGELDIVVMDGGCLVFAEVKYRRNEACGNPLEAVDDRKQRRICRTALYYCMKKGYGAAMPCRFDVLAIESAGEITHIKNAFEFQY